MRGTGQRERWQQAQTVRVGAWGHVYIAVMILALLALLGRVVQLKVQPPTKLAQAAGTAISSRTEIARRGDLCDRRGRVIATSSLGNRLFVDPEVIQARGDLGTIAVRLAALIDADPIDLDRQIQARLDRRYVVLDHLLEDWQAAAIRQAQLPGVGLEPRLVRQYPAGAVGASIVGLVGFEHTGLGGFEHHFEDALHAAPGRLTYLRDVRRRPLWIHPAGHQPAQAGADIRLSIDLVIQELAERRLHEAVEEANAGGGRLVVVDCQTGEILAMCDELRDRDDWEPVAQDPARRQNPALARNRCVTDPYEPGSTFKPFVWALGTELGKARPGEIIDCPTEKPHVTSFGRRIRDSHYEGPVTWSMVLIKSLNSGMAIVAERLSREQMQEGIHRFGFGARTGSGLPGESPGLVTSRSDWSHYTQTSVSFGHEIAVTMLQMVRAFSVFARDGTMPSLRVTAKEPEDDAYRFEHRILPPEVALLTRQTLRRVMVEGTGARVDSVRYRLFGKSGTPQLARRDGGGYYEDRYRPSFIAGAPLAQPRLVVLCVIDDPDRAIAHFGADVAGPVVRDVIDGALQYLGVPPDQSEDDAAETAPAPGEAGSTIQR